MIHPEIGDMCWFLTAISVELDTFKFFYDRKQRKYHYDEFIDKMFNTKSCFIYRNNQGMFITVIRTMQKWTSDLKN